MTLIEPPKATLRLMIETWKEIVTGSWGDGERAFSVVVCVIFPFVWVVSGQAWRRCTLGYMRGDYTANQVQNFAASLQ